MALSALQRDLREAVDRARRNVVLMAVAGLCFVTAYCAALIAIGAALYPLVGLAWAATIETGGLLVIGGLILLVRHGLKVRDRRRLARRRAAQRMVASTVFSLLPMLGKSKHALLLAALGGLAYWVTSQTTGATEDDPV